MLWENPEAFIPERWLDEQTATTGNLVHSENFIPFLVGPRACIGKELAMLEMLLVCSNVLARFDLELMSDDPIDFIGLPILKPRSGAIWAKVTKVQ